MTHEGQVFMVAVDHRMVEAMAINFLYMTTITLFLILGIVLIIVWFITVMFMPGLWNGDKEVLLQYYSSLLSDMNVDYKDKKISPENIEKITESMRNMTKQVEKIAPQIEKSDEATKKWFIGIIDEFHDALSLWTERHADEISAYESALENKNSPTISLLEKRLQIQAENIRKVVS